VRTRASSTCAASTATCWTAGGTADATPRRGLLGNNILGKGLDFDIEIHLGAGAYICGEESALIESLEGKPGKPRIRPPFPVTCGYLGQPTIVNNVETLALAALIALHGGKWFSAIGTAASTGTKVLSVSGDVARPGIYEYPFGVTIAQVLEADAGAVDPQAVTSAGAAGSCLDASEFGRTHRVRGRAHRRLHHGVRAAARHVRGGAQLCTLLRPRELRLLHALPRRHCRQRKLMDKLANDHGSPYDLDEMMRRCTASCRVPAIAAWATPPRLPCTTCCTSFARRSSDVCTRPTTSPRSISTPRSHRRGA
jgi:[NiFe] hydrogenase diaphorase moiety large subunit